MDDLKLFGKDYTKKNSLVQKVHFVSSGVLGSVAKKRGQWIEKLGIKIRITLY